MHTRTLITGNPAGQATRLAAAALLTLLLGVLTGPVAAQSMQEPGASGQPRTQQPELEPETTNYKDWELACIETDQGETCQMRQTLEIRDQRAEGLFLQVVVRREGDRYALEILLPLGVDLRPGVRMRVDEGDPMEAGFVTCIQQGCIAAREITREQLETLQAGRNLTVAFRAMQEENPFLFDVSLMGFTAASNRLK